jgi:hypothetical protein
VTPVGGQFDFLSNDWEARLTGLLTGSPFRRTRNNDDGAPYSNMDDWKWNVAFVLLVIGLCGIWGSLIWAALK